MTLEEMKLAVCGKLTDLLIVRDYMSGPTALWKSNYCQISWLTEGLQVCHEAEKLLDYDQWISYVGRLATWDLTQPNPHNPWLFSHAAHATYEQRLEALCRVWWPERFV